MGNDRVMGMLSIAAKAGKLSSGEYMTESSVKEGKAKLVIIAGDSSQNTRKNFTDMCSFYKVPLRIYSDKEGLGRTIGKEFRASVAVLDEGIAKKIMELTDNKQ
ncbi:MAG: ribosomal L7Ae/L30e/S12e/Gadd45 family protein [Lachnospiraceae bacterium]|nr:ribosomal L7Ae/L30e/S12e/Gadd45 family protein [Lachnospiraceae bacterium]